jgi:hypothetical protein
VNDLRLFLFKLTGFFFFLEIVLQRNVVTRLLYFLGIVFCLHFAVVVHFLFVKLVLMVEHCHFFLKLALKIFR